MGLPATYSDAQRALSKLMKFEDVKKMRDQAKALQVYAAQAKDKVLIMQAIGVREAAEIRAGEVLIETKASGERHRGHGDQKSKSQRATPIPKLSDLGITKSQSSRWQEKARWSKAKQDAKVREACRVAVAAIEGTKEIIAAARAEQSEKKRAKRAKRERETAEKIVALPQKKYGVIYADPEWKFEFWSEEGKNISSPDNHYETSDLEEIIARDVPSIAANDCVLFLWATAPMMPQALQVMRAWGFKYVSQAVWVKHKAGTGFWFRGQHELILVGVRGKIPAPSPKDVASSVIQARAKEHSRKPVDVAELIEKYFPTLPKIEMNARGKARPGWDVWGLEAES